MHRLTPIARPFKSAQANKNLRPSSTKQRSRGPTGRSRGAMVRGAVFEA